MPPMSLPENGDGLSVEQLLSSDAVWLLSERAASAARSSAPPIRASSAGRRREGRLLTGHSPRSTPTLTLIVLLKA